MCGVAESEGGSGTGAVLDGLPAGAVEGVECLQALRGPLGSERWAGQHGGKDNDGGCESHPAVTRGG